jgi:hypothetical protein
MTLKLHRWNNRAVPGAYVGRLQYIDPTEWEPYLDRHLTEVDEATVPEKQLLRLWQEAGASPEDFDRRNGVGVFTLEDLTLAEIPAEDAPIRMLQAGIVMPGVFPAVQDPE